MNFLNLNALNLPVNLIAWLVQSLALTLAAALCGRWPHARTRLWFWQGVLALCVLLPLVPWRAAPATFVPNAAGSVTVSSTVAVGITAPHWSLWTWDTALWILGAGVALRLAWMGLGLWRLRTLRLGARQLPSTASGGAAHWYVSDEVHSPVTYGFMRPRILLPSSVLTMPEGLLQAIAFHELAHVERGDWLVVMAEETIRALLWFQPAIWYTLAQIQQAREETVDEYAVRRSGDRQTYVEALLAVAEHRLEPDLAPAPLFLRKRQLAARVSALMQELSMSRIAILSRLVPATASVAAAVTLAIWWMPLSAQAQTVGDAPGITVDAGGALLHRAPIRTPANYSASGLVIVEAKLNTAGEVSDARVTSGPEELRRDALSSILQWHYDTQAGSPSVVRITIQYAPQGGTAAVPVPVQIPGGISNRLGRADPAATRTVTGLEFTGVEGALRARIQNRLAGTVGSEVSFAAFSDIIRKIADVDSHVRTTLRNMEDGKSVVIEVLGPTPTLVGALLPAGAAPGQRTFAMPDGVISPTPPPVSVPGRIAVGGNVQAFKLIQKVDPAYPPLARQARIQGTVKLNAAIGRDGHVIELSVISGHPLMVQSALDAVHQWVYQPTLLNGQPTEVTTQIDVNFTLTE